MLQTQLASFFRPNRINRRIHNRIKCAKTYRFNYPTLCGTTKCCEKCSANTSYIYLFSHHFIIMVTRWAEENIQTMTRFAQVSANKSANSLHSLRAQPIQKLLLVQQRPTRDHWMAVANLGRFRCSCVCHNFNRTCAEGIFSRILLFCIYSSLLIPSVVIC